MFCFSFQFKPYVWQKQVFAGRNPTLVARLFSGAHVRLINDSMLLSSKAFQWHTQRCSARWEQALCLAASRTWWADFNNSVYMPLCFFYSIGKM